MWKLSYQNEDLEKQLKAGLTDLNNRKFIECETVEQVVIVPETHIKYDDKSDVENAFVIGLLKVKL